MPTPRPVLATTWASRPLGATGSVPGWATSGYFVLLFSTLGYFFPVFGQGNTPVAIGCASLLLWAVHFLVMRGIKEAAFINQVTTVAKIVPLLMFIVIAAVAFSADILDP